jgi:hypothetical protein
VNYLKQLGIDSLTPLLDAIERIDLAQNRVLLCDVLCEIGQDHPEVIAARLQHPSSNVVKAMMYILDRINPPNKLQLLATLLEHTNLVLRLETLNTLGRNPSEQTLPFVVKCLKGPDAQMRTAAARVMQFFPADRAAAELLFQANAEDFPKRDRNEQRAVWGGLVMVNHPKCQAFIQGILGQKSNLWTKGKVDAAKQLMIEAMAQNVSIPMLQTLAAVAQDTTQSAQIQALAKSAALEMKDRLLGSRPAGPAQSQ